MYICFIILIKKIYYYIILKHYIDIKVDVQITEYLKNITLFIT